MKPEDPINLDKKQYEDLIRRISLADSPVGIDAQYTHAVIIRYLQQISRRLERLETAISQKK